MTNLWGTLPDVKRITTPSVILKEQAAALQEMTKGQLACEIVQSSQPPQLLQTVRLVAPALGNYRVPMFVVSHGVISYPCIVTDQIAGLGVRQAQDEAAFTDLLGKILGSDKVKTIIGQLLAQIAATANTNATGT